MKPPSMRNRSSASINTSALAWVACAASGPSQVLGAVASISSRALLVAEGDKVGATASVARTGDTQSRARTPAQANKRGYEMIMQSNNEHASSFLEHYSAFLHSALCPSESELGLINAVRYPA